MAKNLTAAVRRGKKEVDDADAELRVGTEEAALGRSLESFAALSGALANATAASGTMRETTMAIAAG